MLLIKPLLNLNVNKCLFYHTWLMNMKIQLIL